MNKIEFQRRLEEVEGLIAKGEYAEAVNRSDLLNLDLIKEPRRLQNISKAYEKCHRYADAEDLLLLAREYAPRSRGILFHLCMVAVKGGEIEEAKNYYQEFCNIARYDSERFVLQYRIAKAEQKSDDVLIGILEEYKRNEPDDRWMFELARLYAKNGDSEKAIEICEEIELWFSSGKYVQYTKALYAQLTGTAPVLEETPAESAAGPAVNERAAYAEREDEEAQEASEAEAPAEETEADEEAADEAAREAAKEAAAKAEAARTAAAAAAAAKAAAVKTAADAKAAETKSHGEAYDPIGAGAAFDLSILDEEDAVPETAAAEASVEDEDSDMKIVGTDDLSGSDRESVYSASGTKVKETVESLPYRGPYSVPGMGVPGSYAAQKPVRIEDEPADAAEDKKNESASFALPEYVAVEFEDETAETETPIEERAGQAAADLRDILDMSFIMDAGEPAAAGVKKPEAGAEKAGAETAAAEAGDAEVTIFGGAGIAEAPVDTELSENADAAEPEEDADIDAEEETAGLNEVEIEISEEEELAFEAERARMQAREQIASDPDFWTNVRFDDFGEATEEAPKQQDEHVVFTVTEPDSYAASEAAAETDEDVEEFLAAEAAAAAAEAAALEREAEKARLAAEEAEREARRKREAEAKRVEMEEEDEGFPDLSFTLEEEDTEEVEEELPVDDGDEDFLKEIKRRTGDSKLFGHLPIEPEVSKDTWHFVVYGETNALTLECAREHLKEIGDETPSCPSKMLKISSDKIGGASIVRSLDHFLGNMVIVEQAASLSDDQLAEFAKVLDRDDRSLLVVFTDSRDDMIGMFRRVPALADSFTAVFEGKELNARDLVNTVKEYLLSQDAKMDKGATAIVTERARRVLAENQGFYKNNMRDFAERALGYADRGGFLGLSGGRCDDEGFLIVSEKHFRKADRG